MKISSNQNTEEIIKKRMSVKIMYLKSKMSGSSAFLTKKSARFGVVMEKKAGNNVYLTVYF